MKGTVAAPSAAHRVARALADRGLIRSDQLAEAREVVSSVLRPAPSGPATAADSATPTDRVRPRLAEIGGYAGSALVVAAAFLFFLQTWATLSPTGRSVILGLITVALLGSAALVAFVAGDWRGLRAGVAEARRRLVGTLTVAGAGTAAFAVGTWVLHQQGPGAADTTSVNAGLAVALVVLVAGYALAPLVLTHLALAAVSMALVLNLLGELAEGRTTGAWATAAGLITLGVVWLVLAERGVLREQTVGRLVGAALTVFGSQSLLELQDVWPAWTLTFVLAAALFALYWWRSDWPYLAVAVVGLTVSVTEAVIDWTEGSVGAGGGVLAAGLTLLAASGAAFVIRSRRERHEHLAESHELAA